MIFYNESDISKKKVTIHIRNLLLFVCIWLWFVCNNDVVSLRSCESDRPFLRFHKIRICHKSNQPVIAWKNVATVLECMNYSRERNGLAFNFSPPEVANLSRTRIRTCEVLGCPETGSASTLILNEAYDYYSAYGNLNVTENATCTKSVGVFDLIEEKLNYTEAIQYCQSLGGDLANVLSEVRTTTLAKLVGNEITEWYKATYVGLDDMNSEGIFETPLGSSLECSSYRAWGPGHPRSKHKGEDCVILDPKKMWKVISCKIKLPFICEFYPESPLEQTDMITIKSKCNEITDEKKKNKCLKNERDFEKIFKESSRVDKCALMSEAYYYKKRNDN